MDNKIDKGNWLQEELQSVKNQGFMGSLFLSCQCSFSLDTFWKKHLYFKVNERFIHWKFYVLVNTTPVSILFWRTSYSKETEHIIPFMFLSW